MTTNGAASSRPNRRLSARRACLLSVRYKTDGGWHPATVVNISSSGCRLRLGQDLRGGTAVAVQFDTPLRDGATALHADVLGSVSWSRSEGLSFQVGIHFQAPTPELQDLIESLV
jgi:hypothetical protein